MASIIIILQTEHILCLCDNETNMNEVFELITVCAAHIESYIYDADKMYTNITPYQVLTLYQCLQHMIK